MNTPLFYKSKPAFGIDIGQASIKIVQINTKSKVPTVTGYGYIEFDPSAIVKGVIVKPEIISSAISKLLGGVIVGKITTERVFASVPIAYAYTRILTLPELSKEELTEAVKLEVEQYVPIQIEDLYIEYERVSSLHNPSKQDVKANPSLAKAKPSKKELLEKQTNLILMVATPKRIVDSYLEIFNQSGFEVAAIEPTMFANHRAVNQFSPSISPRVVIDFGSHSSDLAIYDGFVRLVNTVETGGAHITEQIMKTLNVNQEQANKVKTHFGIAKSRWQVQLANGLQPILSDFANEVQKTMRYYHEHSPKNAIQDIVMVGGGANMPGLAEFFTHLTGVKVINYNPWKYLQLESLQPPYQSETTIYDTAIGLALNRDNSTND